MQCGRLAALKLVLLSAQLPGLAPAGAEDKQYKAALASFDRALKNNPLCVRARNASAWLLATCPDPQFRNADRAVEQATMACELTTWGDCEVIDTLAAAYAEAGDFECAVKWEQRAIELNAGDVEFIKEAEKRLALYSENKPYRR